MLTWPDPKYPQKPDGRLQEFLSGEVRYASLEKAFPEESQKLRARLEVELNQRYENLKRMADHAFAAEEKSVELSGEDKQPPEPAQAAEKKAEDLNACTVSGTAEHSRSGDPGEPCDDGRAGQE